jgi:hypothetical protein
VIQIVAIKPRTQLIPKAAVLRAITGALTDMAAEGTRFMAEYPPVQPGQRYVRTNTLKRSWSLKPATRVADRIEAAAGSAGNIAPYNRKVQGINQDPFFARRGWRDVDMLVERIRRQLRIRVQRAIDNAARHGGR